MILIFTRRHAPSSYVIQATTASIWSHVACGVGGWAYEATAKHGVIRSNPDDVTRDVAAFGLADVACNDDLAEEFLQSQLGKPYDWSAIYSWYGSRDWQEDDKWFCFELAAAAAAAGFCRLVYNETARVTGGMLWNSVALTRLT